MVMTHAPLAKSLQPVVDAIGYDLAVSFAARFGGTRVWLPAEPRAGTGCSVVQLLGVEAARKLALALGPGQHEVPRCMNWLLARRNEEIMARWLAGETQLELAMRFGVTERTIRNVVRSAKEEAL